MQPTVKERHLSHDLSTQRKAAYLPEQAPYRPSAARTGVLSICAGRAILDLPYLSCIVRPGHDDDGASSWDGLQNHSRFFN
jgi:hypothetical protein